MASRTVTAVLFALLLTCGCNAGPGAEPNPVSTELSTSPMPSLTTASPSPSPQAAVILSGGQRFAVEVVTTDDERARGLMNRVSLPRDRGMLFVFVTDEEHSFWMKNTLIPLDILWLDQGRRVVALHSNVPPCRVDPCPNYAPGARARYVLELNGGAAAEAGLKVGDVVTFENLE